MDAVPGGAPAAAVTTPHVPVVALAEMYTEPELTGLAAPLVFIVPAECAHALLTVAVPHTVAVPAFVLRVADPTVPAEAVVHTDAEPTVPAVVDHVARVPPALT